MQHDNAVTLGEKSPLYSKQRGSVLVICLVMLTILTIIAIGTTTDIGFQSNMARNSQFRLNAFNRSLSELNGQYQKMVKPPQNEALLESALSAGKVTLATSDLTQAPAEDDPFTPEFSVIYLNESKGQTPGEMIASATSTVTYRFEFNSIVTLKNTGIRSDQSIGINRIAPKE